MRNLFLLLQNHLVSRECVFSGAPVITSILIIFIFALLSTNIVSYFAFRRCKISAQPRSAFPPLSASISFPFLLLSQVEIYFCFLENAFPSCTVSASFSQKEKNETLICLKNRQAYFTYFNFWCFYTFEGVFVYIVNVRCRRGGRKPHFGVEKFK